MVISMKKILSIISAVAVLSALFPVYAEFTDVEIYEDAINTVTGLKLMEGYTDGSFQPENNITRAQFAAIISGIYNYGEANSSVDEWKQSFFKDVQEEMKLIEVSELTPVEDIYSDVNSNSEYYRDIMTVTQQGLMSGIDDGIFDPEGSITCEQAVKVVVSMLGYSYNAKLSGGFPNGYMAVASRLGLLSGIETTGYFTRGMTAQMMYNALEIDLMQLELKGIKGSGFHTVEGENMLNMLLNIEKYTGRMTDDGYTTLSQKSVVGENYVSFGDLVLQVDSEHEYARDFIGRNVTVYYQKDENELVYACLSNRDKVVEIAPSEFEDYVVGRIEYIKADENKSRIVRLNQGATVIENGSAKGSFDESIFDFNYGTITIITPKGEANADLIILNKYVNFNIDYVDTANKKIFSKSSLLGNEVDLSEEDKRVRIYKPDGMLTDMQDLTANTVTSICNGDSLVRVYISHKVIENVQVVGTSYNDYDEMVVNAKDSAYIISKDYIDANPDGDMIKLGGIYVLYIDMFGNIVRFTKVAGDDEVGFITNTKILDDDVEKETLMFTYYDPTTEKLEKAYLPEQFTLVYEGENKKTVKKKIKDVKGLTEANKIIQDYITLNGERVGGLCRYSFDENDDITRIELAAEQKATNNEDNRLVKIAIDNSAYKGNVYCSGIIGGKTIIRASTKILLCNYKSESFNESNGFKVTTRSALRDDDIMDNAMIYTTIKDSPIAEFVVCTRDVSKYITTETPHTLGIVRKVYDGLDNDDKPVKKLVMDEGGTEYTVVDDALKPGNVVNVQGDNGYTDADGNKVYYIVESGDIVRYGFDMEGNINLVQLFYDANADYSNGFTINGKTYKNNKNTTGALAGCLDHWDISVPAYSNPYSVEYNESQGIYNFSDKGDAWMLYSNENMRVMLGYAVSGDSEYIKATTQPINISAYDESLEGYVTNICPGKTATLVNLENKEPQISKISLSQIKTYNTVGSRCDKVIITSRIGNPTNIIVIRNKAN